MSSCKILIIDGYNLIHRSKSGFKLGDWPVVFNFFRSLKAELARHKPNKCFFVIEGVPRQKAMFAEYKANRTVTAEPGSKDHDDYLKFHKQKDVILSIMKQIIPLDVIMNPDFEADDVIYNLIHDECKDANAVVMSNDTDFIQLLNEFKNVKIWNPMTKSYVKGVDYDYVSWKSLTGDGSDNIPGIVGCGSVTAEAACQSEQALNECLTKYNFHDGYKRNYELIKFHRFNELERSNLVRWKGNSDWDQFKIELEKMQFKSMLKEKYWNDMIKCFELCN